MVAVRKDERHPGYDDQKKIHPLLGEREGMRLRRAYPLAGVHTTTATGPDHSTKRGNRFTGIVDAVDTTYYPFSVKYGAEVQTLPRCRAGRRGWDTRGAADSISAGPARN